MNQADMLKKVIEYAVERGYPDRHYDKLTSGEFGAIFHSMEDCFPILFSHDFAKAVFGFDTESGTAKINPETELDQWGKLTKWARHLQQAVISEDPIQYYFDHINSKAKE